MREKVVFSELVVWYGVKVTTVIVVALYIIWSLLDAVVKSIPLLVCFLVGHELPELFIERWLRDLQKDGYIRELNIF